MDKDQLEEKFRRGGTVPTHRESMGDFDLYISEGKSSPPHFTSQQFGIQPDDFPFGMYVTFYWIGKGEKLFFGSPSFYCAMQTSQESRIADARRRARSDLDKYERSVKERGGTN